MSCSARLEKDPNREIPIPLPSPLLKRPPLLPLAREQRQGAQPAKSWVQGIELTQDRT